MRHDARLNYTTAGFQKGRALPLFSRIINTSAGGLASGQSKAELGGVPVPIILRRVEFRHLQLAETECDFSGFLSSLPNTQNG